MRLGWSVLTGGEVFDVSRLMFRRWDLAVDFRSCRDVEVGLRTLAALGAVRLPYWGRPHLHHGRLRDDILTGASWPATGHRQFRVYDKGFEQKHPRHRVKGADGELQESPLAADPGTWIRLERQKRPTNHEQFMTRSQLESADLRSMFLGRWASLLDAPAVTVCGTAMAQARIAGLFRANNDRVGLQAARRLIGAIAAADQSLDARLYGSHQALARELAALGIVLSGDLPTWEQVELKPLLLSAARCWPAGKQVADTDRGQGFQAREPQAHRPG